MRLLDHQRQTIKTVVAEIVGADSRIWLFGSRVDDSKRGGDIDLLIMTNDIVPNRADTLCKLEGRFAKYLGDRKIDILLKDARTADAPIYRAAREKGLPL